MKRQLILFMLLIIVISGCSNGTKDDTASFTLKSAITAFQNEGCTIDLNQKPLYEFVNAQDGVFFYLDDELVKLYEFESEEAYVQGIEDLSIIETFPKRELVVIETNSPKAIDIFKTATE